VRVFVTGATGVIGKRAVPLLVAAGHAVTAVGRTPEKRAALERVGATAVAVDLFDPAAVRSAVAGHDVICNLATHIPSSSRMLLPWAWRENDRVRRLVSAHLVEAALAGGVQRFIQESFGLIYPDRGEAWIDESVRLEPARYNRSVLDAERAAAHFTEGGRTGIVLRFAGFYGPDSPILLDMIKFLRKGWLMLPGPADAYCSSVSHDDAATAVVAALGARPGVYNVVDDEPVRHREYADAFAAALGVKPPKLPPAWMTHLSGSLGETLARSLRISNRKLRDECGWAPKFASVRGFGRAFRGRPECSTPRAATIRSLARSRVPAAPREVPPYSISRSRIASGTSWRNSGCCSRSRAMSARSFCRLLARRLGSLAAQTLPRITSPSLATGSR